jgi:hypothetical protein
MSSQTPSASITLFKHTNHQDVTNFDKSNPEYTNLLTSRSKATLYNMANEQDHHHLLKVLFPQEKNMKMLTDSDFKRTYHLTIATVQVT